MSEPVPLSGSRDIGHKAQTAFSSLNLITRICQGVLDARLQEPDFANNWFAPVSQALDRARLDARRWVDSLGPELADSVPSQVQAFADRFDLTIQQIHRQIEVNPAASGAADPTVIQIAALISELRAAVHTIIEQADKVAVRLRDWGVTLQLSYDELGAQAGRLQTRSVAVLSHIQELSKTIAHLHAQIEAENQQASSKALWLGLALLIGVGALALTPVTMGLSLLVGIPALFAAASNIYDWAFINDRINNQIQVMTQKREKLNIEQRQMLALQALALATRQVCDGMDNGVQALTDLRTSWTVLDSELQGVGEQLVRAEESVSAILQGVFSSAASQQWQAAVTLAGQLLAEPVAGHEDTPESQVA